MVRSCRCSSCLDLRPCAPSTPSQFAPLTKMDFTHCCFIRSFDVVAGRTGGFQVARCCGAVGAPTVGRTTAISAPSFFLTLCRLIACRERRATLRLPSTLVVPLVRRNQGARRVCFSAVTITSAPFLLWYVNLYRLVSLGLLSNCSGLSTPCFLAAIVIAVARHRRSVATDPLRAAELIGCYRAVAFVANSVR